MKTTASTLAFAFAAGVGVLATTAAYSAPRSPQASVAISPSANLSETPAWADRFVDSIGVDAKYEDKYAPLVTTNLLASGIRHIRDSVPTSDYYVGIMKYLGQHGIKHSIGMNRGFAAADLKNRLNIFMPYVDFVEPANEADNYKVPNWALMRSDQKNLWNTVRSNKAWNGVAVAGPSFADPGDHAKFVGPLDEYEDFGNLHNGTCNWNPGTDIVWVSIDANTTKMRVTTKYKPIETTETGYSDNQARGCALTDTQIAHYMPRVTTERWMHGEPRTYFNVLTDRPSDVVFGHLGLMFANGTPKPQFLALGNLINLLKDPGGAPKSTRVTYSINGATVDVHHLLLSRRDGTYDLLLYRELPLYDHFKHQSIPIPAESISLTLPGAKNVVDYRYNTKWSFTGSPIKLGSNHQTANFLVTDTISVIHIGY